jgi:hypothetical protein
MNVGIATFLLHFLILIIPNSLKTDKLFNALKLAGGVSPPANLKAANK